MAYTFLLTVSALMTVTPYRATFLAKKQILYWGYFGLTAWLNGFVFIDRLNPEKARGTMKRVVNIIQERKVSADQCVCVWVGVCLSVSVCVGVMCVCVCTNS